MVLTREKRGKGEIDMLNGILNGWSGSGMRCCFAEGLPENQPEYAENGQNQGEAKYMATYLCGFSRIGEAESAGFCSPYWRIICTGTRSP
jgi:hypothetical protein